MDTILVDISDIGIEPMIGTPVSIFNGLVSDDLSIEKIARKMGTIPYELTCGVARRLQRRYIWRGQILLWEDLKNILGIIDPRDHAKA